MSRLKNILEFIRKERIYAWILVFILITNAFLLFAGPGESLDRLQMRKAEENLLKKEYSLTPERLELLVKEKKEVVIAMNLMVLLVAFLLIIGLVMNIGMFLYKPKEKIFRRGPDLKVKWDVLDICRIVILFVFIGYILGIIELAFMKIFPIIREKEHVRMMLNSSVLDVLITVFVLRIVLVKYKDKLKNLGLSLMNFFKDALLGIAGYIAALPMIIGALVLSIWIAQAVNYDPPIEPILKLFLEERSALFLFYSTIFVTIVGPIFEEIFFRGFVYSAFKKKIGVLGAIFTSSLLFSLLHTNVIGLLPIMVLGILLTYLYERTGSLIPSIVVHIIHNTGMMACVFLIKEVKI